MRIAYYKIPENITEDMARYELRCTYDEYKSGWMEESVKRIKELIKKYGGSGRIEHYDRSGGCFEVTPIKIKGNNSKHKYNRHL